MLNPKTADIEDFIADLKLPRVVNRLPKRTRSPASINHTIELLRHMVNWCQGEMLALRFADIDNKRSLIVPRGQTTKSKKTRVVPISTMRQNLRLTPHVYR